jgi:hypothetical protein
MVRWLTDHHPSNWPEQQGSNNLEILTHCIDLFLSRGWNHFQNVFAISHRESAQLHNRGHLQDKKIVLDKPFNEILL